MQKSLRWNLDYKEINGDEHQGCSDQTEAMENEVEPCVFVTDSIKDCAECVGHSSHKEKEEGWEPTDGFKKRPEGDDDKPAHADIVDHAEDSEFLEIDRVEGNANGAQGDTATIDDPGPHRAHGHNADQTIWGVCSSDEDIDHVVIQNPQNAFAIVPSKGVIDARSRIAKQ